MAQMGILGVGALMMALISIQTVVNEHAQQKLQGQLDKIQHNTETPPTVTVNPQINLPPPLAPKEHTRVQFMELQTTTELPLLPYRKDEKPAIAIGYLNVGEFPVADSKLAAKAVVAPLDDYAKIFKKYRPSLNFPGSLSAGTFNPHIGRALYHTFFGPSLTEEDVSKLTVDKRCCAA
jgi:hypothetical protein